MQLIDTHVHLNFDVFRADLELLQSRWREAKVIHVVHACVKPQEFPEMQAIADRLGNLSLAVGLHPLDADDWREESDQEILDYARSGERVVAIGELGLDFYKANNPDWQKQVLWKQLEIAYQLDKPVIIHCRDAAEPLRVILEEFKRQKGQIRGVMHCWSGTPEETQWFLELGLYISFSGIVTFKKAQTVQQAAQIVPSDRLLVETDCPFLAPVPHRGKRNEPAFVYHVATHLAELRQQPLESLAQQTTENAINLFRLKV